MTKSKIFFFISLILVQGTGQKKYSLENHAIDLTVDSNWEYQKVSDDTYAFKFKCDKDVAFCKNIVIKIIKNTENATVDQITQALIDYTSKKFEQFKVVAVKDGTINNRQFRVIDYKCREQNTNLGSTTLVTLRNKEIISIYFTALNQPAKNYVNERKLLFEVLKSLEIKG